MKTQFQIATEIIEKIVNPPSLTFSAILTTAVGGYGWISNTSLFGVSILFVMIVCSFMVVDWFLGVYASVVILKKPFKSGKVTYTIMKFVTLFMWLFFVNQAKQEYSDYSWAHEVIITIQIFVLILIALREFVSIGENIEKIWGTKPYLFKLIDDVFATIERLFKRKLEKAVEGIDEKINGEKEN